MGIDTYRALRVTDSKRVKDFKTTLERLKLIDTAHKIKRDEQTTASAAAFLVPVRQDAETELPQDLAELLVTVEEEKKEQDAGHSKGEKATDLKTVINRVLASQLVQERLVALGLTADELMQTAPARYLVYPPLLLFSPGAFTGTAAWTKVLSESETSTVFFKGLLDQLNFSTGTREDADAGKLLTHVAENAPIPDKHDILRLPSKLRPLHPSAAAFADDTNNGDGFWCTATQNGIRQTWAPMHTMFSRGNIKEKARILHLASAYYRDTRPQRKTTAVDLYAGIGYFTFSYAASQAVKSVLCWELNPWSTRGLVKGAGMNGWDVVDVTASERGSSGSEESVFTKDLIAMESDPVDPPPTASAHTKSNRKDTPKPRIVVFNEDNALAYTRIAAACSAGGAGDRPLISHINMGLLPHARLALPTAARLALLSGLPQVHLHVHENVAFDAFESFIESVRQTLLDLCAEYTEERERVDVEFVHLEKIKTYAPGVWHVCGDFVITKH